MAQYNIDHLNYIASSDDRTLLNMDTSLNLADFYDYVHLLAIEEFKDRADPRLSDILIEQRGTDFYKTRFIEALSTYVSADEPFADDISGSVDDKAQYWNEHRLSTTVSALAYSKLIDSIVLNEQQQYYNENLSSDFKWIRLYLSCCTIEHKQQLLDYYNSTHKYSMTYEIEHSQVDREKNIATLSAGENINSLYQLMDVCIKSPNYIDHSNMIDVDVTLPTKTEDIYLPSAAQPKDFCQAGNYAYILTTPTSVSPVVLRLSSEYTSYLPTNRYTMSFSSEPLSTFLYKPRSECSCDSYRQLMSSMDYNISDFFVPTRSVDNVRYSYIAAMPMANIVKSNAQTDYDNGNVYADIIASKSMYNSTYSMQMPTSSDLANCRQYEEINTCAGSPYLKYNDNISCSIGSASAVGQKYEYPKIESLQLVESRDQKLHKSYFFSVNIADLKLDDIAEKHIAMEKRERLNAIRHNIKHDIAEAVKTIVAHTCPAQTQLFEVQFTGEA